MKNFERRLTGEKADRVYRWCLGTFVLSTTAAFSFGCKTEFAECEVDCGGSSGSGGSVGAGGTSPTGGVFGAAGSENGAGGTVVQEGERRCAADAVPEIYSKDSGWVAQDACSVKCVAGECVDDCTPGAFECENATNLRECNALGQWESRSCGSCSQGNCNQQVTLCVDQKVSSTVLMFEFTCAGRTTKLSFLSATADATGCFRTATTLCSEGGSINMAITGSSSQMAPDGIFVGPNSSGAQLCGDATCTQEMPKTGLFVRARACDGDNDGPSGCP